MPLSVIILAAGHGTRMRSDRPKVLQPLAGRPMLAHLLDTVACVGADAVYVVYGYGGDAVPSTLAAYDVDWVLQIERLGTGHAVMQALPSVPDENTVLILCGDVPLLRRTTLKKLAAAGHEDA